MLKIKKNKYGFYFSDEICNITDIAFCYALEINLDEFQNKMKEFGAIEIIRNDFRTKECFFQSKKKALNALDWIESILVMKKMGL